MKREPPRGGRSTRTSATDPIRVDFVDAGLPGRLGLTFAPGKHDRLAQTGIWQRDLDADLRRLRDHFQVDLLVSLIERHEFELLGVVDLLSRVEAVGIATRWLPIPDASVPRSTETLGVLVDELIGALRQGKCVVVHCRGGLGRAGLVAACTLVGVGRSAEQAIEMVRAARPGTVETRGQELFIEDFERLHTSVPVGVIQRAEGALLGLLVGDSLGSLVEFQSPTEIARRYPDGVRELQDGGTWNTRAGQPTDDGELCLCLARALVSNGALDPHAVLDGYVDWIESSPFDVGGTIGAALRAASSARRQRTSPSAAASRAANPQSQANGALMRLAPIPILGWASPLGTVARWASQDAKLTHPNRVCLEANGIMAGAMAHAIKTGAEPREVYRVALDLAHATKADEVVLGALRDAVQGPPEDLTHQMGWLRHALQLSFHELLHAPGFEDALVGVVGRGGDTDTNGAIAGQLLGAVHGVEAIPERWRKVVLACKPEAGRPGVHRPRPEWLWPGQAVELAHQLVRRGAEQRGAGGGSAF